MQLAMIGLAPMGRNVVEHPLGGGLQVEHP